MNIERRLLIDSSKLSGEAYFSSLLQEAYACGLLCDSDMEKLQMECISFLAYKCERYNSGDSSSIRMEAAESIMKSNLYTIGLYLKSLPDADTAVDVLKSTGIMEMYQRGRELINTRLEFTRRLYKLVKENRLTTPNYTYNATLSAEGIGSFFKLYDPDYGAQETMASVDYQLCNTVVDLAGVEYIQKYLVNLHHENEFCRFFSPEDIHRLLTGYDSGYKDLLINIFEQVLTGALGCILTNCDVRKLYIPERNITSLQSRWSGCDDGAITSELYIAALKLAEELHISGPPLLSYITGSLPKVAANITRAVRTATLNKTLAIAVDASLSPKVKFLSGAKMDDREYLKLVDELLACRYSSDKLALIKDKVRSLDDFEEMLSDAQLCDAEMVSAFRILGNIELAVLIARHPFKADIQAVELSAEEQRLRACLQDYIARLSYERQKQIREILDNLIDDEV